jgi:NMD protein affecting ribosome stability and mRNA decay
MNVGRGSSFRTRAEIRATVKRGTRSDKGSPLALQSRTLQGTTVCERCGAVYRNKTWHDPGMRHQLLASDPEWTVCPACRLEARGEGFGRVRIRGHYAFEHQDEISHRLRNVIDRARSRNPERRLVSLVFREQEMEVLTTSQKLAHRIARELEKTFGGRAIYHWGDHDGELLAVWERRL